MNKTCKNCAFANYTGGQEGTSEKDKKPLSRFPNIYCYNPLRQGYKEKDNTCDDFNERETEIFEGIFQSKKK